MNKSILDVQGEILVVSQFTLMASTKKGTAPLTSGLPDMKLPFLYTNTSAMN